jgi:hypothetical protein
MRKPVITSMHQYTEEYVLALTAAITDGLNDQVCLIGQEHVRTLSMTIITSLVASILYKELTVKATSKKDKKNAAEVIAYFTDTKDMMQSAVAAGFEMAMQKFTGKPIEYYCQVKTVPLAPSNSSN